MSAINLGPLGDVAGDLAIDSIDLILDVVLASSLQNAVKSLPKRVVVVNLTRIDLLLQQLLDSCEYLLQRVELGRVRRNVQNLGVFLDEHRGQPRDGFLLATVPMDGVEVDHDVDLFAVALDDTTEAAGFEVDQELFDDIEEMFPRNESVLKVEVENTMLRGSDHHRDDDWVVGVAAPHAAAEFVEVDEGLLGFD